MAVLNQAKYLSFDHQYVETVVVTDATRLGAGVAANRLVNRSGGYPSANGYAAGVSLFDIYGPSVLSGYTELALGNISIAPQVGDATKGDATFATASTTDNLLAGATFSVNNADGSVTQYVVESISTGTAAVVYLLGGGNVPTVTTRPAVRKELKGGYGVNPPSGLNANYEDRLNASTTPYAPRIFPYQRNLSLVTTGIAIVEVDASQTIVLDSPIAVGTDGKAKLWTTGIVAGRALDAITTGASDSGYIRVKLGTGAN